MPNRIAQYQIVPTQTLQDQERADAAASWGRTQRASIAADWAAMHLQDAEDTLGPLVQASQEPQQTQGIDATASQVSPDAPPTPAPIQDAYEAAGAYTDSVDTSGDRPPSEFEPPSQFGPPVGQSEPGASVGGSFDRGRSVGGSFADDQGPPDLVQTAGAAARLALPGLTGQYGAPFEPAGRKDVRAFGGAMAQGLASLPAQQDAVARAGAAMERGEEPAPADLEAWQNTALALTPEPLANAGGKVAGKVLGAAADEVARLRLDKFPEGVRSLVEEAATQGDFWQSQRRNVIPDAVAERMADDLNRSVDDLVSAGQAGRAWNTEETRALRNGLTGQALKVDDLKQTVEALGDKASDAITRELGQEEAKLLALSRVAEGARAEAGRAFRAYVSDTRGRLARANGPQYTSVSRVPTEAPAPAPGRATPAITEQPPLITEPVAASGRKTNLLGETETVGAGARSVYDRASLVRMAGMLSAVPTHLLNIAGNTVMGGTTLLKEGQVGADLLRVGAGRLLRKDVERQRFQAEVGPQVAAYGRGLWAGVQQIPGIMKGDLPQDFVRNYDARGLQSGSKVLDTAVEFPLRALAASDAVFRGAALSGHSAALATRQAVQEGLKGPAVAQRAQEILGNISDYPHILDAANHLAARDVFQEGRAFTDAITKAKQEHMSARIAGDIILPFYRTPYNVAAQGAGMTPAGYASVLTAARKGDTGEAVDRVVRATVGTMAMGAGLQLASNNLLTGAYPADATDRSTLPEGWKPYSLRIPQGDGAVYVPIQSLGAWAVPLGAAAVVIDAQKRGVDKNDLQKGIYAGLGGIGQFMGDMSALQGLNSVFKLVSEPERSVERTGESLAASFVPVSGLARQVQQALGDAQRDPDNPLQAFMAGVPGLSQFVPEKQTPLGQTRERGPSGPTALVSGSRIGVERPNSVTAALRAADIGIPEPPKTVSYENVTGIPLTESEQRAYRTAAGTELSAQVEAMLKHPKWGTVGRADRAKLLEGAVQDARKAAALAAIKAMGKDEIKRRMAARLQAA